MSSDPAINAAQRAWVARYGVSQLDRFTEDCADDENVAAFVTESAREALAPLREVHKAYEWTWCGEVIVSCPECGRVWPCATATLIYPAEELR